MRASHRLGVDFGTSNSAAGFAEGGNIRLIEVDPGQVTLPTAFFFDFDSRETLMGARANAALLDGLEGRYMRALKRVLGTPLMHEERQILNQTVSFVDIIGWFLRLIKTRAEATTGLTFERALSGRPVRFHSEDPEREARAEADLRACYLAAGFREVDFMAEPEAAALATRPGDSGRKMGLVVDIGGGTSDFSLFEVERGGRINILTNQGVTIGGTDFDRLLSVDHVMAQLGRGGALRKEFGPGVLTAPQAVFADLATWEKIPFQYGPKALRAARDMRALAVEPERFDRLCTLLEYELGHDLAFAVERAKIGVNADSGQVARVEMGFLAPGLSAGFSHAQMQASLAPTTDRIRHCARETLRSAGIAPARVDHVVYVGGSSLLQPVSEAIGADFPAAEPVYSSVFTAVTDGLALAA